jgi:hypothetical protein
LVRHRNVTTFNRLEQNFACIDYRTTTSSRIEMAPTRNTTLEDRKIFFLVPEAAALTIELDDLEAPLAFVAASEADVAMAVE